jgi:hypothetical protein
LLEAVQTADDPVPAVTALAGWLDEREDPRGLVVRLSTECWPFWQRGEGSDAEDALRNRGCYPIVNGWLGLDETDRDTVEFQLTTPLLYLSFGPYVAPRPELREVVQAGWVWFWKFEGRPDIDFWLHEPGPVREVCFEHNPTIRDNDLRRISHVPHLKWLDLSCPHVTDAGLAHLHRTQTLREVRLLPSRHGKVTKKGIVELQEALPDCKIFA